MCDRTAPRLVGRNPRFIDRQPRCIGEVSEMARDARSLDE